MLNSPLIPDFSSLRVAVVGDLVVDHYLYARPQRLSREAPVMVLRHEREDQGAGGAANVARNLRALGAEVCIFGAAGMDSAGRDLLELLKGHRIDVAGIEMLPGWTTPMKTRILAAEARRSLQQVLRIDREPAAPADSATRQRVAQRVRALSGKIDALLVADYEYGMVCKDVAAAVRELAASGTLVVLDPRDHLDAFRGVSALTPNMSELARFTGASPESLDEHSRLREVALGFLERVQSRWLLVTRGNRGMALFGEGIDPKGVTVAASGTGEVTDVCGAGDTAAAVFALALASGQAPTEAMVLANAASGVVVMEHGAAMCSRAQLRSALPAAPAVRRLGLASIA